MADCHEENKAVPTYLLVALGVRNLAALTRDAHHHQDHRRPRPSRLSTFPIRWMLAKRVRHHQALHLESVALLLDLHCWGPSRACVT